jgi:SAM-dependent methyltransferase
MNATDRITAEQLFHDEQAQLRAAEFAYRREELRFNDDAYLNHETWIRPALAQLGPLRNLNVLDYGCGHGMAAVVMARRGARVTAFDLSPGYLGEVTRRALANDVHVECVQADGHRLPFADRSFDRIWGNAVLHHLDMATAAREVWRILRPGGIAVFCEPWGENPILSWARCRLPYPRKQRTADERPLGASDIAVLRQTFPALEIRGYQLLSMARRILGKGQLLAGLERCDDVLLSRLPALQKLCRYVVLTLRR